MRSADKGVLDAGFRMTEFPVARDGASFQAVVDNGKFHGTIAATTPSGNRWISARLSDGVGEIWS